MATRIKLTIRLTRPERKARTRDQLLDAAGTVFARRGYAGATLDEVAEAAGFTKGALYSNFASKDELFLALIDRRVEHEAQRLAGLGEGSAPPPTIQSEAGPASGADPAAVDQQAFSLDWLILAMEFWLYAMRDERVREKVAGQYERFRVAATQLIAGRFASLGQEPPMPPRDLAILIEAIGGGLGIQHALDPDKVPLSLQRVAVERLLGFEIFAARTDGTSGPEARTGEATP